MDSALPSFSRTRSTVMRVPATTGLPIITLGSETINGSLIVSLQPDSTRAAEWTAESRSRRQVGSTPPLFKCPENGQHQPEREERPAACCCWATRLLDSHAEKSKIHCF